MLWWSSTHSGKDVDIVGGRREEGRRKEENGKQWIMEDEENGAAGKASSTISRYEQGRFNVGVHHFLGDNFVSEGCRATDESACVIGIHTSEIYLL